MSLLGSIGGLIGSEQGEDKQYAADQQALQLQRDMFNAAKENYAPYLGIGKGSTGLLSRLYGLDGSAPDMSAFFTSPDYQFRLGEGDKAIQNSAAANGGLFSGAAGKALTKYNSNLASGEFNNYIDRLFGMTNTGQNAAAGISGLGQNYANNSGNIWQHIGQNQANQKMSKWNAIGDIGDQIAGAAMGGMYGMPASGSGATAKAAIPAGSQGFLTALFGM